MNRFLILDIGAGTMDVLYYNMESGLHYKAVAASPVLSVAEKAAGLKGNLILTGTEMGGGTLSTVLKQRAEEAEVIMSVSAAATVHHNLERVRSWGIRVVDDKKAENLAQSNENSSLITGDLEVDRLRHLIKGLGIPFSFDVVGICAQDHGVPPDGISHLDYRHRIFKINLDQNPFPHAMLYDVDEVPKSMSRLSSIGESAKMLPTDEIYVMDSGMAAILGSSMDPRARQKERSLVLDVATSHTIGAALEGEEIAGFFEYHTHNITLDRLEVLLVDLADGKLQHHQVLAEGGHGAYIRKAFGFQAADIIVATGPKRRLVKDIRFPIVFGAPLGDNMMTGTVGVLEAIRRRKGLRPVSYL